MALNVKKVSQLNEVSYSTVDGSALFYIVTNSGDKNYNIQLSNLFLATNNLSTFKFANNTLQISPNAINASGTFNLTGALNTGNTAITGTLGVSGTSNLSGALNAGNTAITGTLGVSGTSNLHNTAITGTLGVSGTSNLHNTAITGTLTATSLVKSGGTSSQFLKADGSVDSNSYLTSSLGVNQTWQNVTASRSSGSTYTNSTSKPIMVCVVCIAHSGGTSPSYFYINDVLMGSGGENVSPSDTNSFNFIIPVDSTYRVVSSGIVMWSELR